MEALEAGSTFEAFVEGTGLTTGRASLTSHVNGVSSHVSGAVLNAGSGREGNVGFKCGVVDN